MGFLSAQIEPVRARLIEHGIKTELSLAGKNAREARVLMLEDEVLLACA